MTCYNPLMESLSDFKNFLWVFLLGIAPAVFWMIYLYRKDKIEPEPRRLIFQIFLRGAVMVAPAALLNMLLAFFYTLVFGLSLALVFGSKNIIYQSGIQILSPYILYVLAAPMVEEYLKYYVLKRFIVSHPEFDEPMDGIIYAAAVGLGFAAVENVIYLINHFQSFNTTFFLRAVLSVPAHALFTTITGYALVQEKLGGNQDVSLSVTKALCLAMVAHALFNLAANVPVVGIVFLVGWVAFLWKRLNRSIRISYADSPHLAEEFEQGSYSAKETEIDNE